MTANEKLRDLILSHQIGINRLANREVRRVLSILARIERELVRVAGSLPLGVGSYRLELLLGELQRIIPETYAELHGYLRERLVELGTAESQIARELLRQAVPREVRFLLAGEAELPRAFLVHLARSRPFQGKLLHNWARRLEAITRRAVAGVIREGIREGMSIPQIVRLIRGTRANGYTDGVLALGRRQAEAVARSAVQHVMQGARVKTYQESGVVKGYQWLSTLDLRTTLEYCVPRDHLVWDLHFSPVGHEFTWGGGPGRIHWNCRSSNTAVLKSWRDLGVDKDELPPSARASMDGKVAGTTTAEDWLKRQLTDPGRRAQLVATWGKERVELFESGRLGIADMVKHDGGLIRLRDLRRLYGLAP